MDIVHTPLQNQSLKCEATITFRLLIKINIFNVLSSRSSQGLGTKKLYVVNSISGGVRYGFQTSVYSASSSQG